MIIKVFIENEAGSNKKNIFNEKTLEYKRTHVLSRKYPYPYGFILETTSGDGDNVDCFVITKKKLKTGEIVECETAALMEQIETSWDDSKKDIEEEDNKILAVLKNEEIEIKDEIKKELGECVLHAFDHIPHKKIRVGRFLDKGAADEYIRKCRDEK